MIVTPINYQEAVSGSPNALFTRLYLIVKLLERDMGAGFRGQG